MFGKAMNRILAGVVLLLAGCISHIEVPESELLPTLSTDPKWAPFSEYISGATRKVNSRWYRLLSESRVYPPAGSSVIVVFVMNAQGQIARIQDVKNRSSDGGMKACVSAITSAAPYGLWTEEMKAVLGAEQELTFTFTYQ